MITCGNCTSKSDPVCGNYLYQKPRSHCADVATVIPMQDSRYTVMHRDTFHKKINCVLTFYRRYPGIAPVLEKARRRLIPGSPWSTYGAARWSHGSCRYTPVLPRLFTVMSRYLPVAPRLHAGSATVASRCYFTL